jgi:hypothetical protein
MSSFPSRKEANINFFAHSSFTSPVHHQAAIKNPHSLSELLHKVVATTIEVGLFIPHLRQCCMMMMMVLHQGRQASPLPTSRQRLWQLDRPTSQTAYNNKVLDAFCNSD